MNTDPIVVHPRFALATTVVVREAGAEAGFLAGLKNISLSGCCLDTPRQIPENARVRVVMQLADLRADVWGVIRRRDAKGVGIQFTNGTTVEDWKRLESLVKQLETAAPPESAAASASR